MVQVVQLLVYGLQVGSIYALLAIGYTLVYGIIKMINLAHADFMMLGAFTALFLCQWLTSSGVVLWLSILIALLTMAIVGLIGVFVERVAYKPRVIGRLCQVWLQPLASVCFYKISCAVFRQ